VPIRGRRQPIAREVPRLFTKHEFLQAEQAGIQVPFGDLLHILSPGLTNYLQTAKVYSL